jgi:ribosomal protein S1
VNSHDWVKVKKTMPIGTMVDAVITSHKPFGLLVSIDDSACGVIERLRMERDGYQTPKDYPAVGERVRCEVLGFRDWSKQVEVSMPSKVLENCDQSDGHERAIEVGLRMTADRGMEFFGIDEVNSAIEEGAVVKGVEKGRALMTKVIEGEEIVRVKFEGFSVVVVLSARAKKVSADTFRTSGDLGVS